MSLKLLVNDDKIYSAFQEYLDGQIASQQKILEFHTEPTVIYKAQGALAVLRKLKNLRESVNQNG